MMATERERIRTLNDREPREKADYVLYWSQMNRRIESNHALAHAAGIADECNLPLLVYEGLTYEARGASDRTFRFVLEAVPGLAQDLKRIGAGYFFYLRSTPDDPNDLLYRLADRARLIVTDDYPWGIAADHNKRVPKKLEIPFIAVDSSCIVPMSVHQKQAYGAYTLRPKIQRELPRWLKPVGPIKLRKKWNDRYIPPDVRNLRTAVTSKNIEPLIAECRIDHSIPASISFEGGGDTARAHLKMFLQEKLRRYAKESNQPSLHATSDLSPYLHFGQISALEVGLAVREHAQENHFIADDFLEELIVRRELAFNFARFEPNVESLRALPAWCRKTMAKHARDKRPWLYTPKQFERAETHDDLWNATQKELLLRGKIHGYYRMYWGKKIIEWSPTYDKALKIMIHLHDLYALDGRDPNTFTNILWCFGLHDRPWGERPVFGQLRYMSIEGMKRKTDTAAYISEIAELEQTGKDSHRI